MIPDTLDEQERSLVCRQTSHEVGIKKKEIKRKREREDRRRRRQEEESPLARDAGSRVASREVKDTREEQSPARDEYLMTTPISS